MGRDAVLSACTHRQAPQGIEWVEDVTGGVTASVEPWRAGRSSGCDRRDKA